VVVRHEEVPARLAPPGGVGDYAAKCLDTPGDLESAKNSASSRGKSPANASGNLSRRSWRSISRSSDEAGRPAVSRSAGSTSWSPISIPMTTGCPNSVAESGSSGSGHLCGYLRQTRLGRLADLGSVAIVFFKFLSDHCRKLRVIRAGRGAVKNHQLLGHSL
jgi:hypothetical protein